MPSRSVVVVGGASHIGRSVVSRYSDAGYEVLCLVGASGPKGVERLSGVTVIHVDLSDLSAVEALIVSEGRITGADALVLLAADVKSSSLSQVSGTDLLNAVSIGALAGFLLMGAIGPAMSTRGYGRIVIGSSIGVRFGGGIDSFAYALSKHASEFIPREAQLWAKNDVLTNVVRIGVTNTPAHSAFPGRNLEERVRQIPAGRSASVDEIADFLFWYGSASNTFVTGQVVAISGGE